MKFKIGENINATVPTTQYKQLGLMGLREFGYETREADRFILSSVSAYLENSMESKQEILLKVSSRQFKNVILNNLRPSNSLRINKYFFGGKIDELSFSLYRIKRLEFIDYNITLFKGTISNDSEGITIYATFSMIWIYKLSIILLAFIFASLDIFVLVSDDQVKFPLFLLFIITQGFIIISIWFQYRFRFKRDKEQYIKILKSLFDYIEIKNVR